MYWGEIFFIEGPQRPPPGLSGLHVVPPLPSPAANVGRRPFAQASPQSAAASVRWSLCSLGQRWNVMRARLRLVCVPSRHHARRSHQLYVSHGEQTFVLIVRNSELTYLPHFLTD